jgi:hypothetical protein
MKLRNKIESLTGARGGGKRRDRDERKEERPGGGQKKRAKWKNIKYYL